MQHWEKGEAADLPAPTGEEEDPGADFDDDSADDAQEAAKQTLALLQSGRPLGDDEILG